MTIRVGINGFGRIGRNFYRALAAQQAEGKAKGIEILAVYGLTAPPAPPPLVYRAPSPCPRHGEDPPEPHTPPAPSSRSSLRGNGMGQRSGVPPGTMRGVPGPARSPRH